MKIEVNFMCKIIYTPHTLNIKKQTKEKSKKSENYKPVLSY